MRQALLGLLLAAAASGCGGGAAAEIGPGSSAVRTAPPAGDAWAEAVQRLTNVQTGRYEATLVTQRCSKASAVDCTLVGQSISDTGVFTTQPSSVESEVRLEQAASETNGATSTRVLARLLPDGTLFTRNLTTGDTCWTGWGKNPVQDLSATYRSGLAVLRAAEVAYDLPSAPRKVELTGQVDALRIIRMLGVPESLDRNYGITAAVRKELASRTVGIVLEVGPDGSTLGFQADGRQIATEIYGGQIDLATSFLVTVQNSRASFTLRDLNSPQSVQAPSDAQVLAPNASTTSCAA